MRLPTLACSYDRHIFSATTCGPRAIRAAAAWHARRRPGGSTNLRGYAREKARQLRHRKRALQLPPGASIAVSLAPNMGSIRRRVVRFESQRISTKSSRPT